MEADWEVEIGGGAPVMDASWPGWINLRESPERICEIPETVSFPALSKLLLELNSPQSQVWTSKCDVWILEECDPFEMNGTVATAVTGFAAYVDVLPRKETVFPSLAMAERWARAAVERLQGSVCFCSRADLVVRQAVAADQVGFGVTVYASACAANGQEAAKALEQALLVLSQELTG